MDMNKEGIMKKQLKDESVYRLLHPKLTVLVTSVDRKGKANVMACAWTTPVSTYPPLVAICLWKGHYTSQLINETKNFTLNIPGKSLMRAACIVGSETGRDVDKARKAGLTYVPAMKVKAPHIEECLAHIECRLYRRYDGGECYIFVGRVVAASVDTTYFRKVWKQNACVLMHVGENYFTVPGKTVKG